MGYTVIVGPEAEAALRRLPPAVADCVRQELRRLGDDPNGLGRPAVPPLKFDGQVFPFRCDVGGTRYYFYALFRYGADEQALHVEEFAISTLT